MVGAVITGRWNFLETLRRGTLSRVGLSEGWLASLGMTVGRVAVRTAMVVGWALTGSGKKLREIAALSTCLWVGFEL